MVFKCQENSFLKEYESKVVSCEKFNWSNGASKEVVEGYNVVLNETILFPEGGGQPCDFGSLNGKPVRNVIRVGDKAVHFVETNEPFELDEIVNQKIDWERRLDHMQQHSGQHLITALFDREYGFDTKSWWLGSESSYIELNATDISKEQIINIENLANNLILENRSVTVNVTTKEDSKKFQDFRAPRGLPEDHVGPVRVITIEGIESNMCCGTHVSNLSQLQCVKLLHVEKAKNKLYLHFLVGKRVTKKLDECYAREQQMNVILKGGPNSHIDLIQKLHTSSKTVQKSFQKLLKEVAIFEAEKLKSIESQPKYFCLHRNDGIEPDFITTFLRNAPTENIFYFLTVGDGSGKGHIVLRGDLNDVQKFGKIFLEILDGKGNGKGNNFQAKVNKLSKLNECEAKLKEHFQ